MASRSAADQLLERLVWLAKRGIAPNALSLLPQQAKLVEKVIAVFGSLAIARKRMPGDWRRASAFDTPAVVASTLTRLHAAGQRLTPRRLRELGEEQLVKAVYARFGSFARARRAAGLPDREQALPRPDAIPITTKIESLDEYRRWLEINPRTRRPDLPRALARSLDYHVGGIAEARRTLALPPLRWNRERVIGALVEELRAGRHVTSDAFVAEGRTDIVNAIYRHVGSIVEARALAEAVVDAHVRPTRRPKPRRAQRVPKRPVPTVTPLVQDERVLPGVTPTVGSKHWSKFIAVCRVAADRGAGPPLEFNVVLPAALLSGLHEQVVADGEVILELLNSRADLLETMAPKADHLLLAGIANALECAGVRVSSLMIKRCRGWVAMLNTSPAIAKAASLARLVGAHRMSASAADRHSAQALLREHEVKVEHFIGTLLSRRHRVGDSRDWLNLVRATLDERRRELDPVELLWAARIRYHHLGGAAIGSVAARLAHDLAG